eukprot:scaffold4385_cov90-Skeletonema_marinoi.AAC.3
MQNFNKARGCFALILCAVYPLLCRYLPDDTLQDTVFCRAAAAAMVAVTVHMYTLIKDYGRALFIVYAGGAAHFMLRGVWIPTILLRIT